MKNIWGVLMLAGAAMLVLSVSGSSVMAQETQAVKAVDAGNRICPVMGGEASPEIVTEYKGKVYHLCCPGCIKAFQNDPEKYSKIADEEAAAQEAK